MEKQEQQLITRLNNTKALQKAAYEELDIALKSPKAPTGITSPRSDIDNVNLPEIQ